MSSSTRTFFPYPPLDTESYAESAYDRNFSCPQHHCVPRSFEKHQELFHRKSLSELFKNCVSPNSRNSSVSKDLPCVVRKKKVSFADDRGLNLVEVREIPNAPKWVDDVITLLIGNSKRSVVKEKKWKVAFDHPPWSDERLIEKLEKNMVALEYVSVKEGTDDMLFGAAKVKNLAFEKEIFVRVTYDRWQSYINIPCAYMKLGQENEDIDEYDTFCFNTKIWPIASKYEVIEFSVCFRCDGKEYWDNNGDINYRLVAEYFKSPVVDSHQAILSKPIKHMQQHTSLGKIEANEMDIWSKIMLGEPY